MVHNEPTGGFSYLNYTENKGQWDAKILYKTDFRGGNLFVENDAFTFVFYPKNGVPSHHTHTKTEYEQQKNLTFHALRMEFEGVLPNHQVIPSETQSFYQNYFIGNDPKKWASHVPVHKTVLHKNMYKGIDVKVFGRGNNVRYDFILSAGADPATIQLKFIGHDRLFLRNEQLVIKTSGGEVIQEQPYAYQEQKDGSVKKITCNYVLAGDHLGFKVTGDYNKNLPLVIDPTLIFSTYTGSTSDNWGMSASFDISGNAYTAGICFGSGYPTTPGAFQLAFLGPGVYPGGDITLSKFNSTGSTLLFSTYLGGTNIESPQSITVDNNNCLIVLGRTYSPDFPVISGCYDLIKSGGTDITVTKFNSTGTALLGSTFIGGSLDDGINFNDSEIILGSLKKNYADDARGAIHVDANNNIYVASSTASSDFPITPGCFQPSNGGMQDGCVFKFNPTITTLLYSSYIGGSANDAAYNLALDALNGLYLTGGTESSNFPTTPGALITSYGGNIDGFVTHISPSANTILQSSYIGTSLYDQSYFVQVDGDNDVYLYGQCSGNYPITPGTYSNSNSGQFIHKLDSVLGATFFSTEFGTGSGNPDIVPSAFLVDNCKSIYISGWGGPMGGFNYSLSTTSGMPITANAFQSTTDGNDFYFASFKQNAALLQYATFFGGAISAEHVDGGTSCFDKTGVIYQAICASCGANQDLPTTPGVWSITNNSNNCNNGLVKYQMDLINTLAQANLSSNILSGCAPFTASLINSSANAISFVWEFGDGSTSTSPAPTYTYSNVGTYVIRLIASDSTTCNKSDTAFLNITVLPPAALVPQMAKADICKGDNVPLGINFPAANAYTWTPASTLNNPNIANPIAFPPVSTIYSLSLNDSLCRVVSTRTVLVDVHQNITEIIDQALCSGDIITLQTNSVYMSYQWNSGQTTPSITGLLEGLYTVSTVDSFGCAGFDSSRIYQRIPITPLNFVMCEGSYEQLLGPQGNYQYTWTPALTLNNANIWNPYASPPSNTIYTLTLAYGPCISSNTFSILVKPRPQALISTNGANLCLTDTMQLNTPTSANYQSYAWSTGDTTATIIVTQQGNYTVTVTGYNGCVSVDTMVLRKTPPFSTKGASVTICEGQSIQLEGDSGYTYRWFPEYRLTGHTEREATVSPGVTSVYTLIISNGRCASAVDHTVYVNPAPPLSLLSNYASILPGESVQLEAVADTTTIWSPNYMLSCFDCPNPIVDPLETTTYYCYVVDKLGCTNTQTVIVEVIPTLYVPSCFTPNGDGVNDVFKPEHSGFTKISMEIYDRWGEVVHSYDNLNGGWNGTYKGKICQDGYYAYKLYATDNQHKQIEKAGSVLLMK